MKCDFIVIGAGIFGIELALKLSQSNYSVTLIEMENDILTKASKMNQNRVHLGFHYPRSMPTAQQAIESYSYFINRFSRAIRPSIESYYMISQEESNKTNITEYAKFCSNLGVKYKTKNKNFFERFINTNRIEDTVFQVEETVFDIAEIKKQLIEELSVSNISILFNTKIDKIDILNNGDKKVYSNNFTCYANYVVNCTYSNINKVLNGLPFGTDLRFQNVLLPVINSSNYIPGMTIMDGPFCSILPKGLSSGEYIVSDVEKSIIHEAKSIDELPPLCVIDRVESSRKIIDSASQYIKFPEDIRVVDYWLTRKAISVKKNDERTTHVINHEFSGVFSILQGKISTSQIVFNELMTLVK